MQGDALDASEEVLYNFNTLAVHENFMKLVNENQGVGGDVPFVIPAGNPGNGSCNDSGMQRQPQLAIDSRQPSRRQPAADSQQPQESSRQVAPSNCQTAASSWHPAVRPAAGRRQRSNNNDKRLVNSEEQRACGGQHTDSGKQHS